MIDIPFSPQRYDYVIVPGIIYRNRKQLLIDFLVDTGASTTMVDPRIMDSLGYSAHCSEFLGPVSVSGPAGKEAGYRIKAHRLLIHSAQLTVSDIDIACIRPERNVEALLGLNFLKHFHYCVNHDTHTLSLRPL